MSEFDAQILTWLDENADELTDSKLHEMYDQALNESYDSIDICGYKYSPAYALEQVDPTAYRCGFVDWLDAWDDITEFGGRYWYVSDYETAVEAVCAEEYGE
jgi:hypothetical protein